jgi:sugar lactone lactonase YvrE
MRCHVVFQFLAFFFAAANARTQSIPYETNAYVESIAGSGFIGHVDGNSTLTMFNYPTAITADAETNLFVWDSNNRALRRITADYRVTTMYSNFPARLTSLTMDGDELLAAGFIGTGSDVGMWRIRMGAVVGSPRLLPNEPVEQHAPGLVRTSAGIFFSRNNRIYVLTNNTFEIFVGSGNKESVDGQGIFCSFNRPTGLAADSVNNIYVMEAYNVRRVTPQGVVTTVSSVDNMNSLAVSPGGVMCWSTIYLVERWISGSRRIIGGKAGQSGFKDGEAPESLFAVPQGVTFGPDNALYVADSQRIRRIVFDTLPATQLGIELRPTVTLTGQIGQRFRIEGRASISDPWAPLDTLSLTASPFSWSDPDYPNHPNRYYRSVLVP